MTTRKQMEKTARRMLRRHLDRGEIRGGGYRWSKSSDAGRCVRCRTSPYHMSIIEPVYRGTRVEWVVPRRVGRIYHTDNLCLEHAAEVFLPVPG